MNGMQATSAELNIQVPIIQGRCQSNSFSVARIAELLLSPQRCSRVTELCWGKIVIKGMLVNVVGRRADGDDWMSDGSN